MGEFILLPMTHLWAHSKQQCVTPSTETTAAGKSCSWAHVKEGVTYVRRWKKRAEVCADKGVGHRAGSHTAHCNAREKISAQETQSELISVRRY